MTELVTDVLVCQEDQRTTRIAICMTCEMYVYDETAMYGRCSMSDNKPVPVLGTLSDEVCPLNKW